MIEIREFYGGDYCPPLDYRRHLEKALPFIPAKVTRDLGQVLLRDSRTLGRNEARLRVPEGGVVSDALGLYYRREGKRLARIELFVDKILERYPPWVLKAPILRYELLGRVFFHELGHHVYACDNPRHPSNEDAATRTGKKLLGEYYRHRYRWLIPVAYLIAFPLKIARRLARK